MWREPALEAVSPPCSQHRELGEGALQVVQAGHAATNTSQMRTAFSLSILPAAGRTRAVAPDLCADSSRFDPQDAKGRSR
ncbi:MAG: hypothetical protein M5T61_03335 [Acidimicrobiia bacterium]|nr:hypothetical protein [Acidimicrobiia bacterium]